MRPVLDEQDDLDPGSDSLAQRHHDAMRAWVSTPPPGPWALQAACAGLPVSSFVDPVGAAAVTWAEHVCASCPVRADCGDYAVAAHAWGVWGGQLRRAGKPQPRAS